MDITLDTMTVASKENLFVRIKSFKVSQVSQITTITYYKATYYQK